MSRSLRRRAFAAVLVLSAVGGAAQVSARQKAAEAPQVELRNRALRMRVYLPDAQKGFYRGVRFDWSGVIGDLEVAGHHLYQPWFTAVDPQVRDFVYSADGVTAGANSAATGPVEEFQTAFGYDTAKVGDTFLKVGVGILRKVEDRPYRFDTRAELVDGGRWTTQHTADLITFTQTLGKPGDRYAYVYTKVLKLGADASFTIQHRLQNLGTVALTTPLYDHNFLTIDSGSVHAGTTVTVAYTLAPRGPADSAQVSLEGHRATYRADLQGQDKATFALQGFPAGANDYFFLVNDPKSDVTVRIEGDKPLVDASVWSIKPVIAVEPFIQVDAQPGGEFRWKYSYDFVMGIK